jgi:hypothetical protein
MSYGCSSFGSHRPMRRYLEGCGRKAKWGGKCPRKEGRRVSVCLPVSPSTISPLIFPIIMMLDSFFDANTTTVTTALGHYSGFDCLSTKNNNFLRSLRSPLALTRFTRSPSPRPDLSRHSSPRLRVLFVLFDLSSRSLSPFSSISCRLHLLSR